MASIAHLAAIMSSAQGPFAWQFAYPTQQYSASSHSASAAAPLSSNTDQPACSTPAGAPQESSRELQIVNMVLPSKGHIFATTGGSNQEHMSKRAKKDHQRRVLTVTPRVPLNRPAWSTVPITFDESDFQVRDFPHTDAFVVTANVAGFTLHNILLDNGSSADILFAKPFETMGFDRRAVEPAGSPLYRFWGQEGRRSRKEINPGIIRRRQPSSNRGHHL